MTHMPIHAYSQSLNLYNYDREILRAVADSGGTLRWCNGGEWRLVPNGVLRDALTTMDVHEALKRRNRIAELPAFVGRISWSQAVTPNLPPSEDT